ncbi:MAG TPA: hypothetical protein VEH77_06140 [Roseiarcus sp.]|nr:hypothetical protein [Roseiarcus sp.]
METALLYVLITLLMAGVVLSFGLPFLVAAWVFARSTRGALADATRLALAAAIAAIGIAPNYDAYRGPLPIFVRLVRGEPVTLIAAVVSLIATWLVLYAVARLVVRRRPAVA